MAAHLSTAVLLLVIAANGNSGEDATGHFEVYCDGVGFFLAKVDGAPAPRKVLLFLYTGFPGVPYVPKEEWKDVNVYRNGCAADGKCEVLTPGRIRLDNEITPDGRRVSGKYEFEFGGQHLHGGFTADRRRYKHPPRICE
jgi:hypothetical protein